jgi:hypothetical protein
VQSSFQNVSFHKQDIAFVCNSLGAELPNRVLMFANLFRGRDPMFLNHANSSENGNQDILSTLVPSSFSPLGVAC